MTDTFPKLNLAILCMSDGSDLDIEQRAEHLTDRVLSQGHKVLAVKTVSADRTAAVAQIHTWADDQRMDAILVIDRSIFADSTPTSTISFSDAPDNGLAYSLILTDAPEGFIGVINIKAMRALPA
ncbi:hypothetical protein MMA231_03905 (plasmid) [Asticcacaulis sp. MM231]|uniref:hypothetical protein n=1 Tax=Asticcacaulis sp. MM231 TaxID=3157666 RepID=UPI0032D56A19